MLRIAIQENDETVVIKLDGRIVWPWVAELSHVWAETAPRLSSRKLSLDVRNVTYMDADGKRALADIYALTSAEFVANTPWTRYLAEEIAANARDRVAGKTLLRRGDNPMHPATKTGHGSAQELSSKESITDADRQSIEDDLRHTLDRAELTLHYQPKINIATGAVVGAEALSRWLHPLRGSIPPARFIPIADSSGMILPIGAWVLREACAQARTWANAGMPARTVAVNVSAAEFQSENFLENLFATLSSTGLDPGSLELDIAEDVLSNDPKHAKTILKSARDKGVRVSVDNLDLDHCSFGVLRKLPLNALKVDRSCVRRMTGNPDKTAFLKAIISTGQSLNLRVIAEGVETAEDLAFLREHHCDEAQGFYFGQPVPPWQLGKQPPAR